MKNVLEIATSQIGVKEISGEEDNQTIVAYAHESGFDWVNDDETPWCSIFANWCAMKAGLKGSEMANARSWLDLPLEVEHPEPGDIVVFWRESPTSWKGHVGFFMGFDRSATRIYTLGGNQGNQVSITAYSASQLLGFRRLKNTGDFALPEPILKKGSTGQQVKRLQDVLKILAYEPGTSDGVFGGKTKSALVQFQEKQGLTVDGIFGQESLFVMNNLLMA